MGCQPTSEDKLMHSIMDLQGLTAQIWTIFQQECINTLNKFARNLSLIPGQENSMYSIITNNIEKGY